MPRGEAITRCLVLLSELANSPCGLTVPELLDMLDIERRTLYRDMDRIEALGVAITRERVHFAASSQKEPRVRLRIKPADLCPIRELGRALLKPAEAGS